jgi:hypothetical protein
VEEVNYLWNDRVGRIKIRQKAGYKNKSKGRVRWLSFLSSIRMNRYKLYNIDKLFLK